MLISRILERISGTLDAVKVPRTEASRDQQMVTSHTRVISNLNSDEKIFFLLDDAAALTAISDRYWARLAALPQRPDHVRH